MQMTLLRGGCDYDYYDNIYTAATAEREGEGRESQAFMRAITYFEYICI